MEIAQAEIMENDLDARIQAVRVYGSRTMDGLYTEDSDVDVVIAYEGTVREDDLFSVLNEAGYKVGNMRVDMNPIRPDKTGTLKDFLEKSERYLNEKMEQMKTRGEYKPLAKVEELEEANYNMIDNVLNNMPPKKERITMLRNVMNTIALAKYIRVPIWMRYLKNTGKSLMTQR